MHHSVMFLRFEVNILERWWREVHKYKSALTSRSFNQMPAMNLIEQQNLLFIVVSFIYSNDFNE